MENTDQLLTITQVAIAIAGFAGLIGTFQFKDGERIKRGDAIGLALIVNTGLMGALYSTLPLIFSSFGINDSAVWAISSGFACVIYIYFIFYTAKRLKNFKMFKPINKIMIYLLFLIAFLIVFINLLNSLDIVFEREFGPFYISLIYALGSVCYMFSRLFLRPIWRKIRQQESENLTD